MIDAGTAEKHHYKVGDSIGVAADGPLRQFTITGTGKLGGVDSIGGLTLAVFDLPTAQALLHKQGQFDAIYVAAARASRRPSSRARSSRCCRPSPRSRPPTRQARRAPRSSARASVRSATFLLVFGGIALFVGAFVIFNTLSITVAQRAREFATLRTLGASRRQVLRSVMLEAAVIGLVASVIGMLARPRHRQGPGRALHGARPRPAEGRHRARDPHGRRLAARRHAS